MSNTNDGLLKLLNVLMVLMMNFLIYKFYFTSSIFCLVVNEMSHLPLSAETDPRTVCLDVGVGLKQCNGIKLIVSILPGVKKNNNNRP